VVQMMDEASIEVPSTEEPLTEEPVIRGSFAEMLSSLPVEVVHAVLVTVALQQLASVVVKPAWVPADILSFALVLASD
jgi:hypothetical protein